MAVPGNLTLKRMVFVVLAAAPVGGFAWGVLNPPSGWDNIAGRLIHGVLAVPVTVFTMFARPDKVPSWTYIAIAFLLLCLVAVRWPRSTEPGSADDRG